MVWKTTLKIIFSKISIWVGRKLGQNVKIKRKSDKQKFTNSRARYFETKKLAIIPFLFSIYLFN